MNDDVSNTDFDSTYQLYRWIVCGGVVYKQLAKLATRPACDLIPYLKVRLGNMSCLYSSTEWHQVAEWILLDLRNESSIDYDMGA